MKELRGRKALVTGAAGGLGGYISSALAAEGVDLVLADLPNASFDGLPDRLRKQGVAVEPLEVDLTDRAQAEELVPRAEEALGPLDILVNNAGVEFGGPFLDRSPQEIEFLVGVNLMAVMVVTRIALPGMLDRGRGHVVNLASMAGKGTFPFLVPYCASKHGVVGFTHALRAEFGDHPVGFSAICPTFISRVGMYGRYEAKVGPPPAAVAPKAPEHVGEAVVKAIHRNRPEVIVAQRGAKGLILLAAMAPRTYGRIGRQRRLREFAERFAAARDAADPTPAEQRVAERD